MVLDETGSTLEQILKDVARVILYNDLEGCQLPRNIIVDKTRLRKIAPLFK